MSSSRKSFFNKRKKEGYYKEAKKTKVRARSYFKLEQVDKKFNLIQDGMNILDLGCAPGAWLEYADNKIKEGNIVGIDLLEIKKQHEFSEKVEIIQGDFNEFESEIEFDLVISDMAPEFSGDSKLDRGRTHKLNNITLNFCEEHLKKGSNLLFKTFEGEDLEFVRNRARKMFKEVKDFKPNSSQKKSSELFIVCRGKL